MHWNYELKKPKGSKTSLSQMPKFTENKNLCVFASDMFCSPLGLPGLFPTQNQDKYGN